MIKRWILKYKYMISLWSLLWLVVFNKVRRLLRPLSDDPELLRMLPFAIFRTCKRRCNNGPLYAEWPFRFELVQAILKCVADFHGEKLFTPVRNAKLFRQSSHQLTTPLAWLFCKRYGYRREHVQADNVSCEWIKPQVTASSSPYVLFYLHGGGYVVFSPQIYLHLATRLMHSIQSYLTDENDVHVFLPDYRKAPEYVFPAAVQDALTAYNYLTIDQNISPNRIIVAGDSAGGGLTLSLLLWLRNQ